MAGWPPRPAAEQVVGNCEVMKNRAGRAARRPLRRSAGTASGGQASSATLQGAGDGRQKSH
jgi:hypothetical protein